MLLVQAKDRNKMKCPLVGNDLDKLFTKRILRNWENAYRGSLCTDMKNYTKNGLLSEENRDKVEY